MRHCHRAEDIQWRKQPATSWAFLVGNTRHIHTIGKIVISRPLILSTPGQFSNRVRWKCILHTDRVRITSYNVCYTKLLRRLPSAGNSLQFGNPESWPLFAITLCTWLERCKRRNFTFQRQGHGRLVEHDFGSHSEVINDIPLKTYNTHLKDRKSMRG